MFSVSRYREGVEGRGGDMATEAVPRCGGRNMRLLIDIWENQETEIEQNMSQNCKHWDLLFLDPLSPA